MCTGGGFVALHVFIEVTIAHPWFRLLVNTTQILRVLYEPTLKKRNKSTLRD